MTRYVLLLVCGVAGIFACHTWAAEPPSPQAATIDATYPGLASGGLGLATLGDLPENVLVQSGSLAVTAQDLDGAIGKAPENMRDSLKKNGFFMLEQMAVKKLVLELAKQTAAQSQKDIAGRSDQDLIGDYIQGVVAPVQVTEDEVAKFYEENKDMCGGAALEQIKDQLKQYVLKEKQQDTVREHIRTLGQRVPIVVSAAWTKEQAVSAKDNPVDKARSSGIPSMVDFGSDGCRPCEMMKPILADLKTKYAGKANVLFVHVREEQILAARYGIQAIPVQVFFDKNGKQTFRHTGFFAQADIEKKLAEMGAQ